MPSSAAWPCLTGACTACMVRMAPTPQEDKTNESLCLRRPWSEVVTSAWTLTLLQLLQLLWGHLPRPSATRPRSAADHVGAVARLFPVDAPPLKTGTPPPTFRMDAVAAAAAAAVATAWRMTRRIWRTWPLLGGWCTTWRWRWVCTTSRHPPLNPHATLAVARRAPATPRLSQEDQADELEGDSPRAIALLPCMEMGGQGCRLAQATHPALDTGCLAPPTVLPPSRPMREHHDPVVAPAAELVALSVSKGEGGSAVPPARDMHLPTLLAWLETATLPPCWVPLLRPLMTLAGLRTGQERVPLTRQRCRLSKLFTRQRMRPGRCVWCVSTTSFPGAELGCCAVIGVI